MLPGCLKALTQTMAKGSRGGDGKTVLHAPSGAGLFLAKSPFVRAILLK